jgi:hypothetical protein
MKQTAKLPKGIQILRGFDMDNGDSVPRRRFERLVDSLDECAVNSKPKATRCHSCPYLSECLERFDAICGRVVMYRRKDKIRTVSQL